MDKVNRHRIADYLNTGTESAEAYSLMGTGFTSLSESPSAKVDKTAYIHNKSASGSITGYENVFPFNSDLIADDAAVMALYEVGRNQKTGEDAEFDYVRVDLYKEAVSSAYPARKFRVAVEITEISGESIETVKVSGNLHQVGDFIEGTFNTTTKSFTPASAE